MDETKRTVQKRDRVPKNDSVNLPRLALRAWRWLNWQIAAGRIDPVTDVDFEREHAHRKELSP